MRECITCAKTFRDDGGAECGACRMYRWRHDGQPRPDELIVRAGQKKQERAMSHDSLGLLDGADTAAREVAPLPESRECSTPNCWRPVYIGDVCKSHHDITWYRAGMPGYHPR